MPPGDGDSSAVGAQLPFVANDRLSLLDLDDLAQPLWGEADQALAAGPAVITSLGTRTRALAHTRPLHDLEANKIRLGGEAWARLNLIELGFHAIDTVALRMDFDSGARHDDVLAATISLIGYQDPTVADPGRVAERVLEGLITGRGGSDAESHSGTYGTWGPDGYVARRFDYALITEHLDDHGEYYLRATDSAISVLMGALELDVESAQMASELRLNELVKRGLMTAAIQEAERARYRSIRYAEQLRRQLANARLHTTSPGVLEAVDELVDHALEHVIDRYRAERAIIANVTSARDEAHEPMARRRANQLIDALHQCERRHQYLQSRLVRARSEFRHLLNQQLSLPPTSVRRIDLERQLLEPVLVAPLMRADRLGRLAFRLAAAPVAPPLVEFDQLVGALCALPPAGDQLGALVGADDELVGVPDRRRFDDDAWDAVDIVLDGIEDPVRLSALLSNPADDRCDAEHHLLSLRAFHLVDPALSEHLRRTGSGGDDAAILVAAPAGERFESALVSGDDLVVARAWLHTGDDELPPDPFAPAQHVARRESDGR